MTISDKARTNKKWTSSDKYKDNYDRIFGKKEEEFIDEFLEENRELMDKPAEPESGETK